MKNTSRTTQPGGLTPAQRAEDAGRRKLTEKRRLSAMRQSLLRHRGLIGCGHGFTAALLCGEGRVCFGGDDRRGQSGCTTWTDVRGVYCGPDYVLGVTGSGGVCVSGGSDAGMRAEAEKLSGATQAACGARHAALLLCGGRVRCIGRTDDPCTQTGEWTDIVDVCCGRDFTAGLTADGHVICAGGSRLLHMKLDAWVNIAGLYADPEGSDVFAISADGCLVSTRRVGRKVRAWRNLASLTISGRGLWGITPGGSLLSARRLTKVTPDDMWDVAAMAAGPRHAVTVDLSGHVEPLGRCIKNGRVLNERPASAPYFGEDDPTGGARLFDDFEQVCDVHDRKGEERARVTRRCMERASEAARLSRRLSCGDRLTAAVTGYDRVSATGGLSAISDRPDVLTVSCGRAHLLALHRDGSVSADGNNTGGCCEVSGWTDVRSVLAVGDRSMALTRDGRVLCAGVCDCGQGDVSDWRHVIVLRGSASCTVGVDRQGHILTAGKGLPSGDALRGPVWEDLADAAVSGQLLVGLSRSGRTAVVQLGSPEDECIPGLDEVNGWQDVRAVSLGDAHIAALCTGGRVMTAGRNDHGQCDTDAWDLMAAVCCTADATLGLREDGTVLCAGSLPDAPEDPGEPLWRDVCALTAGRYHAAALTGRGRVLACGLNTDGQCSGTISFPLVRDHGRTDGITGNPGPYEERSVDENAADDNAEALCATLIGNTETSWLKRQFACGLAHTVTIDPDGTAVICDDRTGRTSPWDGVTSVACTADCTVAAAGGKVVCMGQDQDMDHLVGELEQCLNPSGAFGVPAGSDVFRVAACAYGRVAALRGDGHVFTAGLPGVNCSVRTWRRVTDIACGPRHVAAVTSDGRCLAAGDDAFGQCGVQGSDWHSLIAVSCGDRHTAALRRDGRVVAVGDNANGQCDVGGLTDVTSFVCLPEATVCVHRDGHVTVRGSRPLAKKTAGMTDILAVNGSEYRLILLDKSGRLITV